MQKRNAPVSLDKYKARAASKNMVEPSESKVHVPVLREPAGAVKKGPRPLSEMVGDLEERHYVYERDVREIRDARSDLSLSPSLSETPVRSESVEPVKSATTKTPVQVPQLNIDVLKPPAPVKVLTVAKAVPHNNSNNNQLNLSAQDQGYIERWCNKRAPTIQPHL